MLNDDWQSRGLDHETVPDGVKSTDINSPSAAQVFWAAFAMAQSIDIGGTSGSRQRPPYWFCIMLAIEDSPFDILCVERFSSHLMQADYVDGQKRFHALAWRLGVTVPDIELATLLNHTGEVPWQAAQEILR